MDLQSPRNNKEHHTREMGLKRLIVRRGQSFELQLHFNRPFHFGADYLTFVAETGEFTWLQGKIRLPQKVGLPPLPSESSLPSPFLGTLGPYK